jgi:hypothetical protein
MAGAKTLIGISGEGNLNLSRPSPKKIRAEHICAFPNPRGKVSFMPMMKWTVLVLLAAVPAWAQTPPPAAKSQTLTAEEIVNRIGARDKQLVERRKAFDYDIAITREKLNSDNSVSSTEHDSSIVVGGRGPGYGTRTMSEDPNDEARKTSKEEPFELLKIVDHYNYTLEGIETVDGVECYKIAFTPKPNMPYDNREEKVLNNVAGHIWASTQDFSLIKNEGSLLRPVSVAWIFASLHEMQFHFDAKRMPNGDYGPGRLQYQYLVSIPFMDLHERDTRLMSNYRSSGSTAKKD